MKVYTGKSSASKKAGQNKKLKIAQLAHFWFDVPPKNYGGTERVVSYITEELVRRGHEVTLFAPEGSITNARLISPITSDHLTKIKTYCDRTFNAINTYVCSYAYERAQEFDVIHSHAFYFSFYFCNVVKTPTIHTLHNQMPRDNDAENELFKKYRNLNFVSISDNFRTRCDLNYSATVHHGTPLSVTHSFEPGEYLFWIGRANKHKGELSAIETAKQTDEKLMLAVSAPPDTEEYLQKIVIPHVHDKITLMRYLRYDDIASYYAKAKALLFPIEWEEPFGMVMIEALACATPVIAYNRGSVSEIVRDGVTGFIIDSDDTDRPGKGSWIIKKQGVAGLIEAVQRIPEIDRRNCRKHVEEHFTVEKMVDRYEELYLKVIT